jgi:hypothetical protein
MLHEHFLMYRLGILFRHFYKVLHGLFGWEMIFALLWLGLAWLVCLVLFGLVWLGTVWFGLVTT